MLETPLVCSGVPDEPTRKASGPAWESYRTIWPDAAKRPEPARSDPVNQSTVRQLIDPLAVNLVLAIQIAGSASGSNPNRL